MDEKGVISHTFALPADILGKSGEEGKEGSRGWGYEELKGWVEREGIFKGKGEWVWVEGGERRGKGKGKGRGRGKGEGWWFPGFVGEWVLFDFLISGVVFGFWFVFKIGGGVEERVGEGMGEGVKR